MCDDPAINWPDFPEGTTNIRCWYLYGEFFWDAIISGRQVFCTDQEGCRTI